MRRLGWMICLALVLGLATVGQADDRLFTPAKKNHWAWKPPQRVSLPKVQNAAWLNNPIDAFILARLDAAGLKPAPSASPEQWLRRVTFDLIGLPPTPSEIEGFVRDCGARSAARGAQQDLALGAPHSALEKVVDRLLASPHYGERWGRHWLDLARFAESNGYEFDEARPTAWRYRDYVIASFNADKPYDRFLKEQIAGDELFPDDPQALVATAFNLLGPDMTDAASQAQRRQNTLDDMTETTGLVFLGLTIGCARCHDHKFEPIPQSDFFRLQAFFAPATFRTDLPVADKKTRLSHDEALKKYQKAAAPHLDALAVLEAPARAKLREARLAKLAPDVQEAHRMADAKRTEEQKKLVEITNRFLVVSAKEVEAGLSVKERERQRKLQAELGELNKLKPAPLPSAMGLTDAKGPIPPTRLLRRGELGRPGEELQPGWPLALSPRFQVTSPAIKPLATGSNGRRAALAEWLASPDNPLTARVMVNRLWQHHFGKGLVAMPSDFGVRGESPTHPDVLDWLATEFVRGGWSMKKIHRLMVLSATYRQSSIASKAAVQKDPTNELLSRTNRRRLEGEIIRDTLLAVSGRLNKKMGGPGVFPPLPQEMQADAKDWKASSDPADHVRRSVYIFARRNLRFPFLEVFDFPDSNLSCPKRERSTTAPQALAMLNSSDVVAAARALAARLGKEHGTAEERISAAYLLTLGRRPHADERRLALEFLEQSPLSELCRGLFNLNEFVYVD